MTSIRNHRAPVVSTVSLAFSVSLIVAIYTRTVTETDYMKQAADGVPWVLGGTLTALIALMFAAFCRGTIRTIAVAVGAMLLVFWLLQAGALY